VASNKPDDRSKLAVLAQAVGGNDNSPLTGNVPGVAARWAEAVSIRLIERGSQAYLLLRPTTWITPLSLREEASNFIKARNLKRYNKTANQILNAWIKVLLGAVGDGTEVTLTAFPDQDFSASFVINTRTAYSRLGSP
jgi:hypothetical protein